jgi:hypothetical protein
MGRMGRSVGDVIIRGRDLGRAVWPIRARMKMEAECWRRNAGTDLGYGGHDHKSRRHD